MKIIEDLPTEISNFAPRSDDSGLSGFFDLRRVTSDQQPSRKQKYARLLSCAEMNVIVNLFYFIELSVMAITEKSLKISQNDYYD